MLWLTIETIVVMTHKINTVVLKAHYIEVFHNELIICAIFLIFALDVRFGFFTKLRFKITKLILIGGNADKSGKTEAETMQELLVARGVPEASMILEDDAASTIENFRNSAKMIDPTEPVVFISSGYHMERALKSAKQAGFTNIKRLPAPSPFFEYGENMLSEVVLTINELIKTSPKKRLIH